MSNYRNAAPLIIPERLPALKKNYDQLCVWLNYDEETQSLARQFIDGDYIKPFFVEYIEDFLDVDDDDDDEDERTPVIGFQELWDWCINTNAFSQAKYRGGKDIVLGKGMGRGVPARKGRMGNRAKRGWGVYDHAANFVIRVLRCSWEYDGEWDHGEFDPADLDFELEFFQVWAILAYLQVEWQASQLDDYEIDDLTRVFDEVSLGRPEFGRPA
ncbi:hypothetical protein GGS20DRAFT_548875 [Poronia punctata]|nr:hypothetical protein GGS20DRAFT_548875 [Poronia punctata]